MTPVERSAANILRALVEFIPGGAPHHPGARQLRRLRQGRRWVEQQIATLGMIGERDQGGARRSSSTRSSWTDIFDLGGVWERAKRIFTEPIDRLISLRRAGSSPASSSFIKDAILLPLAELAEGTRGYDC